MPASAEYVSLIRLTLSGIFRELVLHMMILKMPRLQISEAVTNAVKHAYKENNNVGIINIYFWEDFRR
ncbi:ATP-binding protein [Staphylococcus aureus]